MSDPLVKALEHTKGPHQEYAEELAVGIREPLPPEAAFVTVDMLALHEPYTTLGDSHMYCGCGEENWTLDHLVQAAKEADRE